MHTDSANGNAWAKIGRCISHGVAIWALAALPAAAQTGGGDAAIVTPAPAQPGADQVATAGPAVTPTAGLTRADCEKAVALLSSGQLDRGALSSDAKTLAQDAPDLLTCRAVKDDSDAPCKVLTKDDAIAQCRETRSMFHEVRANPKGRGFMFSDVQAEECEKNPMLQQYCAQFRDAARAADASKCASLGALAPNCRALIALDKSLCHAPRGKEFDGHDAHGSDTYGDKLAKGCIEQVQSRAYLAQGLKAVAESGPANQRGFAKAALGEPDACATYADAAVKACVAGAPTPAGSAPSSASKEQ
jgi:hypothetical protein